MTPRTLTDTDKREIRDVEDLIATLTSYADSIARVGFDKHYALNDKFEVYRAIGRLTGSDEIAELADNIAAEIAPVTQEDRDADYGDYLYEQKRELSWNWVDAHSDARRGVWL